MRRVLILAVLGALVATPASRAVRSSSGAEYPSSMAAIGDSVTTARCSSATSCSNAFANSWATGSSRAVASHFLRIKAANPRIRGHASNVAVNGSGMSTFASQATEAVKTKPDYVTVELGSIDICSTEPIGAFAADFRNGMQLLKRRIPKAHVFVLSVPNLPAQVQVLRHDPEGRKALADAGGAATLFNCGRLYPNTTAKQLAAVAAREGAMNAALARECRHFPGCRVDGGAFYDLPLRASYFSRGDWTEFSRDGERAIAAATWKATFRFR